MKDAPAPHFRRVALIGIGLINGSLALVMRREKLANEIVACARTETTLAKARELGLADHTTTSPQDAVEGADLVVIGTPPGSAGPVASAMAPGLAEQAIVTDVGSIKAPIIRDVVPPLPARTGVRPAISLWRPHLPALRRAVVVPVSRRRRGLL